MYTPLILRYDKLEDFLLVGKYRDKVRWRLLLQSSPYEMDFGVDALKNTTIASADKN